MKKYKIELITIDDTCGYHLPTLQIALTQRSYTNTEMAQEIESEFNSMGFFLFQEYPKHEKLYKDYINDLLKEPENVFFDGSDMDQDYFDAIENDEFCEYLYFYFAPISPTIVNNIQFLD